MESPALVCQKVSKHLGLSEYESRVYVALVMGGTSEAGKLSMRCGVPRTKVYTTLKKLKERELVSELPGQPRRFAPTSPAQAFEQYLLLFKERTSKDMISLAESDKVVSLLEEAYEKKQTIVEPQKEEVWIVQDRTEIIGKIRETLSRAKKSVAVVTAENGFIWFYKTFRKLLDRLIENGLIVEIGTPINSHNGHLVRELSYVCKVKHVDIDSPLLYVCSDDHDFFLARLNLNNVHLESGKNLGVYCTSPSLRDLVSLLVPQLTK